MEPHEELLDCIHERFSLLLLQAETFSDLKRFKRLGLTELENEIYTESVISNQECYMATKYNMFN